MDTRFYVGAAGRMIALPDVLTEVDKSAERIGGTGVSLMGRLWRDTLGYRRTWAWRWDALLPEQIPYVEALAYGSVPGPLRLVDPRVSNRLPQQVASGGSVMRSTRGFATTVGGLQYRSLIEATADPTTLPARPLLRGAIEWLRPSAGDGVLYLSAATLDGAWRLPLIGSEPLQLSAWVSGASGVPVTLQWVEYNAAGQAQGYTDPGTSDTVTLASNRWQSVSALVQPQASSVEITPRLVVPTSAGPGSVLVTALQINTLDAERRPAGMVVPCEIPEVSGGWRIGGGSPYVVPDPDVHGYPAAPGLHRIGLKLVETNG